MRTALQIVREAPGMKVSAFMFWRKSQEKKVSTAPGIKRSFMQTRLSGTIAGFNWSFNNGDGWFVRREDGARVPAEIVDGDDSITIEAKRENRTWSLAFVRKEREGETDYYTRRAIELAARYLAEHGIPWEEKHAD